MSAFRASRLLHLFATYIALYCGDTNIPDRTIYNALSSLLLSAIVRVFILLFVNLILNAE